MSTNDGDGCRLREPPPDDLRELFGGPPVESAAERAVRLVAARDVLADLLHDAMSNSVAREHAAHALRLASVASPQPEHYTLPASAREAA